ncbi:MULTISPECIES: WecB/TagA/CpsF family glycosyltransferase [unclassified Leptolyngbya]|uniref:WecB/TagA/CpsF family glycosyltransferase n=2 Tax=unclassified Leptolyngbya TaxID=2650499 RepID=UPI001684B2A3|nr:MULTISPECIES: WecB/TagA/CpsF family glycosyltransferase [unclassified Leptolyngbya]MBD1911486.1 WecB/TagA/CpsF family glycosyltransferase [Leptolyngbya sp. FACHB-8]MBD2155275.1 WecB/TagA/CpsF family glycosyltransferase [Leptolyngbya sp. FACHB-16]
MDTVKILNLEIHNLTMDSFLHQLKAGTVYTPNTDHIMQLQRDAAFMEVYQEADYKVCDSKLLVFASYLLGTPFKDKISGSDLFPAFYNYHQDNEDVTIFLLGAMEGVAAQAQKNINAKVGREMVVGTYSPPFGFEKDEAECQKIIQMVQDSGATVLAVGLGAPKQEKFIHRFKSQFTNVKIFMAIGATLDFEAGNVSRAPKILSELGLEWFYRMCREPKRLWKRYLPAAPRFAYLLLLQKLNLYRDPWQGQGQAKALEQPTDATADAKLPSSPGVSI